MLRLFFGVGIFLATLVVIVVRPYRVTEAMASAGGALLMIAGGFVGIREAASVLIGQWNTLGFFLGLMAISAVAEEAGVFETLAFQAARWGRGNSTRLYIAVFSVGTVISAFLSNDATALILTPVVYALVTRLRLPVLPFMFACTFIADTASFILPVSNPINILILHSFGGGLVTFLRYLALPSLAAVVLNCIIFLWLFRSDLAQDYSLSALPAPRIVDTRFLAVTACILALIVVSYLAASLTGVPLSYVALGGGILMAAAALLLRRLRPAVLVRKISWSLFIFVGGMFIVVKAVEDLGLTAAFGRMLLGLAAGRPLAAVLLVAGGTALGANLINNVPMALVMTSALHGLPPSFTGHESLAYAAIFGADLGPNLTTVGSLATMLWLLILRRRGLEVSTRQYFRLGITFVPALIVLGSLLIWARL
ncbi:MAG: ArsB/NhaD family transporter [Spirochaetia bacterium]|jgi:arsenical pump membrane protein